MNTQVLKQYNQWADEHDWKTVKYDKESRKTFYSFLDFEVKGKKLLDIGCGSGYDLLHYKKMGGNCYGVDASEAEVQIAQTRFPEEKIKLGYSYELPFENNSFDIIVSKYAAQTFEDIALFYKEVNRILKPGGYFVLLATSTMRHFLEKTGKQRDYFKKEVVTSWIYDHSLPLQEISHTMNDYLSDYFLENFILEKFIEEYDEVSTEHINNEKYPGYFIIKARKK